MKKVDGGDIYQPFIIEDIILKKESEKDMPEFETVYGLLDDLLELFGYETSEEIVDCFYEYFLDNVNAIAPAQVKTSLTSLHNDDEKKIKLLCAITNIWRLAVFPALMPFEEDVIQKLIDSGHKVDESEVISYEGLGLDEQEVESYGDDVVGKLYFEDIKRKGVKEVIVTAIGDINITAILDIVNLIRNYYEAEVIFAATYDEEQNDMLVTMSFCS